MPPPRRGMPPPHRGMPPQRAMYHGGYPQHSPYPESNYPAHQNSYYDGGYDDSQSDQTITEFHENPESVGFTNKYASLSSAGSPEMGRGFNAYAPTTAPSSAYALHPTLPAPGTIHHHGHPIKKTYLGRISDERIFASHENFSQISDPSDECPIP